MKPALLFKLSLIGFGILMISAGCRQHGKPLKIDEKNTIYLLKDANEEEGKLVGTYLTTRKFFDGTKERAVQLKKENDLYTLTFALDTAALKLPDLPYQQMQFEMRESIFPGKTVRIVLADKEFETGRAITEINPGPSNINPNSPPAFNPNVSTEAVGAPPTMQIGIDTSKRDSARKARQ